MTRLILVRHGETDWNVEGRYQGQSDVPLNARGREQAARLAEALSGSGIRAIYSSDLSRARETAEALADALGLKVQLDTRLREIDQGEWEGRLFPDIKAKFADEFEKRRSDPLSVAPPGGETVGQVRHRVLAAVEDILHRHPGEAVAVVSHGLALAIVRAQYQGHPIEKVWDLIPDNSTPVEMDV